MSARFCPDCCKPVPADARFCSACGHPLRETPAAQDETEEAPGARASIKKLFAHLRSGEQRPATIVMTDISGFTSLGEEIGPEGLFNLLNDVLKELVTCLVAHGAHIDKYVGDEIVALFGVPVAQERSAERAVLAALAMQSRLEELNAQRRFGDITLGMHVGVNMGAVMVGPVGHQAYQDYTVIGDAVNVAKRLEDEASEGEIYVSDAVRQALGPGFGLEAVGPLRLKGRREPVEVYRVVSAPAQEMRRCEGAPHSVALRAREEQLGRLDVHAEESRSGAGHCVGLVGPVGIGKSCVQAHWLSTVGRGQFCVVQTECYPFGDHFPYLPLVDVCSQLLGLGLEGWPPRVVGDVGETLAAARVPPGSLPGLGWLLRQVGPVADDVESIGLDAVCDALAELLWARAADRPACVAIDDVQWLDEASRDVLLGLLARAQTRPLLVLFTCRQPLPDWVEELREAERVVLPPLPPGVMADLIAAWARPASLPEGTIRAICDRAQGHPYFAKELARFLRQAPDGFPSGFGMPNSLNELFLAQLDGLALPLRHLVQSASIVGEPLSRELLQAAMGEEPLTEELLRSCEQHDLLTRGAGWGQLLFSRRLLFDAAYETIPPGQRRALHGRIADYLQSRLSDGDEAALHAMAHHAYLGYRDHRAVEPLLRSAKRYWAQYATRQTVRAAQSVNEVVASLPDPHEFTAQRAEALLLLAQARQVTGSLEQAEAALMEAGELVRQCEDDTLVARIATASATLSLMQGDHREGSLQFALARAAWERIGDSTRVAQALVGMGLCAQESGDDDRALELYLDAARDETAEAWAKAAAVNNAGVILLEQGRYDEAADWLDRGLELNEAAEDRRGVAHSHCSLGEVRFRLARPLEAQEHLKAAAEIAAQIEDAACLALSQAFLARTLVALGDSSMATALLRGLDGSTLCDSPESTAATRVARVETGLDVHGAPTSGTVARGNALVEELCLRLEASVIAVGSAGEDSVVALRQALPQARDRSLRAHAEWLLAIASGAPRDGPLPEPVEGTVFAVRAGRVVAEG